MCSGHVLRTDRHNSALLEAVQYLEGLREFFRRYRHIFRLSCICLSHRCLLNLGYCVNLYLGYCVDLRLVYSVVQKLGYCVIS